MSRFDFVCEFRPFAPPIFVDFLSGDRGLLGEAGQAFLEYAYYAPLIAIIVAIPLAFD